MTVSFNPLYVLHVLVRQLANSVFGFVSPRSLLTGELFPLVCLSRVVLWGCGDLEGAEPRGEPVLSGGAAQPAEVIGVYPEPGSVCDAVRVGVGLVGERLVAKKGDAGKCLFKQMFHPSVFC